MARLFEAGRRRNHKMKITTTYEIKPDPIYPTIGQLIIQVHVNGNGIPLQQVVYISGNLADIHQFAAGEIDEEEVWERARRNRFKKV